MESPAPASKLAVFPGREWLRCSAYVIDGGMIRPAPGAALESYDPWQSDREASSEVERPFKVLLRLAQRLQPGAEPSKRQRQALERWASANGLLGILPHETLEYTTWPRWRAATEHDADYVWAAQSVVSRLARGWRTRFLPAGPQRPASTSALGAAVDEELVSASAHPVETIYRTWPDGEIGREALGTRWASFFPELGPYEAMRHNYPSFGSEQFWLAYGEPLELFLRWPRRLASALVAFRTAGLSDEERRSGASSLALAEINDAALSVSLTGGMDRHDEIQLGWSSPSLFSCFALLILEALGGGQRAMTCPVCGGVFLSKAYQARFCSSACRATHHKRSWRKARGAGGGAHASSDEEGPR